MRLHLKTKISLSSLLLFIINCFVIVLIIDPSGLMLKLKVPIFICFILFYLLYEFLIRKPLKGKKIITGLIIVLLFLFIPIYGFFVGIIRENTLNYNFVISTVKSFLFIIVLIPILRVDIDLFPILVKWTPIIGIFTILVYLFLGTSFSHNVYNFFVINTQNAIYSINRVYLGISFPSLFYKTSPLLIFPLSYYWYKLINSSGKTSMNFIIMLICFFGLLLTGTRASMLSALIISVIYIFFYIYKRFKFISLVFVLGGLLIFSIIFLKLMSNKKEASNKVKYENVKSYLEEFSSFKTFVFGDGLGSEFYAKGRKKQVTHTELTYMDIYRTYGFFVGGFLFVLIILPLIIIFLKKKCNNNDLPFFIGYLIYLPVAGTNPLLLSSTGFLVISIAYSIFLKNLYNE